MYFNDRWIFKEFIVSCLEILAKTSKEKLHRELGLQKYLFLQNNKKKNTIKHPSPYSKAIDFTRGTKTCTNFSFLRFLLYTFPSGFTKLLCLMEGL